MRGTGRACRRREVGVEEGVRGEFGESKGGEREGLGGSRCGRRWIYGHVDNARLNHCRATGEAFFSPVNGMDKGYLNQVEV